jgi:hypothetical protein
MTWTCLVTHYSVPHVLMQDQRDDRMSICGDLIISADKAGTFLSWIITGDKTWCFLYDPQLKRQLATWKSPSSPRKKKQWQDRSKGKLMLELFFDSSEIVHVEFIPEGATVNKHRYKEILRHLCSSICRVLSFDAGRTGCCYTTTPLHIALCLSKRSWQINRSPFRHTLHTQLISHHAISFSFPAWKKWYVCVIFGHLRSLPQGKPYGTFLQISFSSVSNSYTNAGTLA